MNKDLNEILDIERYRNKNGYVEDITLLPDELHKILDYITSQKNEIERLNNIINKAINYIDDNTYYKDHKGHINIDDLYIILKGVDK